jgi:chromosome segregation ATPase
MSKDYQALYNHYRSVDKKLREDNKKLRKDNKEFKSDPKYKKYDELKTLVLELSDELEKVDHTLNVSNIQYQNACAQIEKLKEEIRRLKDNRPDRLFSTDFKEKEVIQTPPNQKDKYLREQRQKKQFKGHMYYKTVAGMMFESTQHKKSNYYAKHGTWVRFCVNLNSWIGKYSEKQKVAMDGWVGREGIKIEIW